MAVLPAEAFAYRFPTPLAGAWRNTELHRNPVERQRHVLAAAEVAIRLVVALLKADWDRRSVPDVNVERCWTELSRGSFGLWAAAATAISKALAARGDAILSDLLLAWLDPSGKAGPAQLAFRDVIPIRNEAAHHSPPSSEAAELAAEARCRSAVIAFLEQLSPLSELTLFRPISASPRRGGSFDGPWAIYRGADETVVPRNVTWRGHLDERRLHLWVPAVNQALCVEPYIVSARVASLQMDGIHLFAGLDRQGGLVLRHDRSGAVLAAEAPATSEGGAVSLEITAGLSPDLAGRSDEDARRFGGRYELLTIRGKGSVCEVWEARDCRLGGSVAVKLPRQDVSANPELHHRLEREAATLTRLAHPNIIKVLDHIREPDGRSGLVMELAQGGSLRDRSPAPDAAECTQWMLQVGRALAHVHASGTIHRDIRPDNILIGGDGQARLADFDLALDRAEASSAGRFGMGLGLSDYRAPELETGALTMPSSDIYALGVAWDELLSGQLRKRSGIGAGLPDDLAALLRRMTATDPAARPSAEELVGQLQSNASQPPASWAPRAPEAGLETGTFNATLRRFRPNRWGVILSLVAGVSTVVWLSVRSPALGDTPLVASAAGSEQPLPGGGELQTDGREVPMRSIACSGTLPAPPSRLKDRASRDAEFPPGDRPTAKKLNEEGLAARTAARSALEHYAKAVAADPSYVPARYNLACEQARKGDHDAALASLYALERLGTRLARKYLSLSRFDADFGALRADPHYLVLSQAFEVDWSKPLRAQLCEDFGRVATVVDPTRSIRFLSSDRPGERFGASQDLSGKSARVALYRVLETWCKLDGGLRAQEQLAVEWHDRPLLGMSLPACFRGTGPRDCAHSETDCEGESGDFDSAICFERPGAAWVLAGVAQVNITHGSPIESPFDALRNQLLASKR